MIKDFGKKIAVSLFLCAVTQHSFAQLAGIDSAKAAFATYSNNAINSIQASFFISDHYMNIEQYDSAQVWLNKIHEKLPSKKPSLLNYFLTSRQAEVYYYNNLQQLGLQESSKGLQIAQNLNDNVLLRDSYNFLGLFYINLDSSEKAIPFFKNGIRYVSNFNNPDKYISLSRPHHLFGNLAEAYFNLKKYDSALHYSLISLKRATDDKQNRGIVVAHASIGNIYLELLQSDSALINYQKGRIRAAESKDIDVELYCIGGLAKAWSRKGNYSQAKTYLNTGLKILAANPNINRYFSIQFLSMAAAVYKDNKDNDQLVGLLQLKSKIEAEILKNNNSQLQEILKAGVANEKRLLALEVSEAKHEQKLANTRAIILIAVLGALLLGFVFYRKEQNQKLENAILRQNISQDLHDDIGASLSSLHVYGMIAEKNINSNPEKSVEMLQKINAQSKILMDNMSDIVWSMKSSTDQSLTLEAQVKNFTVDLLNDMEIGFSYSMDPAVENMLHSIQLRKNLLLIIKEAINNMVKHSKASEASLNLELKAGKLLLAIRDNGIGFDPSMHSKGNGLCNMQNRVKELGGTIQIDTANGKGTAIVALVPIKQAT